MHHGERLRKIRTDKKMSQENMAMGIGISQASYQEWEPKPYIKEEKLLKFCAALGITIEEFYNYQESATTAKPDGGEGAEIKEILFKIIETQQELLKRYKFLELEHKRLLSEKGESHNINKLRFN